MPLSRGIGFICALAVCLGFAASGPASEKDEGWLKDYSTAEAEAQRLKRPLLIHFFAEWCVPCRRMDREVLRSPEVVAHLRSGFVGVKVDADQHPKLLAKYGVRSLPADVVISVKGQVLIQTRGFQEKKAYEGRLARLSERMKTPDDNNPAPLVPPNGTLLARDQEIKNSAPPENPLPGLNGYSPVSLHSWREWRLGKAEFTGYHQGVAYQMATQTELDDFNASPQKYVPRLLGCDPVILQQTDRAVPGSTKFGAYFDGGLYLFQGDDTRVEFKKSPIRYTKTRHVLRADEGKVEATRLSDKPADPTDAVRQ